MASCSKLGPRRRVSEQLSCRAGRSFQKVLLLLVMSQGACSLSQTTAMGMAGMASRQPVWKSVTYFLQHRSAQTCLPT